MDDREILGQIADLAKEEHALEQSRVGQGLSEQEHERLRSLEVSLDQCWDLLRQRAARREAGLDPDGAALRPPSVIEHYQQ